MTDKTRARPSQGNPIVFEMGVQDNRIRHSGVFKRQVLKNPFNPKSDQSQIFSATPPEIYHHTV